MKLFLKLSRLLFAFLLVFHLIASNAKASDSAQTKSNRPNILFILTDDQRWDAMGCYGNTSIRTPSLDKLAGEGARLDAFYVAAPLCCPSRAIFLTGLYPHQTGVIANHSRLSDDIPTVADLLNDAGYVTGFIGKAHLGGNPKEWGFKECPVYFPLGSLEAKPIRPGNQEDYIIVNGEKKKIEGNVTERFADAAVSFLEKHKTERWFLWFASTAPHEPVVNYPEYPYDAAKILAPPGWPSSQTFKAKGDITGYYSTITMLDKQIGRILEKLGELGLSENTFVFMTSDNGYMLGSHGKTGKSVWFEESVQVPALARWPGKIKPKIEVKSPISSIDFLPTLMELAGVSKKVPGATGVSMLSPLTSNPLPGREIFSEVESGENRFWQMIRTDNFKYVRVQNGEEHLYNMKEDPSETTDLIKSETLDAKKKELFNKLQAWNQTTPVIAKPDVQKGKKNDAKSESKDSD